MPSPRCLRQTLLSLAAELLAAEGEPVGKVSLLIRGPNGSAYFLESQPGELGGAGLSTARAVAPGAIHPRHGLAGTADGQAVGRPGGPSLQ